MNLPPEPSVPLEITTQEVQDLREHGPPPFLLDCREPFEYELAHLSGSVLIPLQELPARLDELPDPAQAIVVYCHHGGRSFQVARWLRQQGYHRAQSMAGGIDDWSQHVDPSVPRYE